MKKPEWWAILLAHRGPGSAVVTVSMYQPHVVDEGFLRCAGPFGSSEMAQFFGRMLLHHWRKEQEQDGISTVEVQQVQPKDVTPVKSARVRKR